MKFIGVYRIILRSLSLKERRRFYVLVILNILISLIDILSVVSVLIAISFYTPGDTLASRYLMPEWLLPADERFLPAIGLLMIFVVKNIAGHFIFRAQRHFIKDVANRISEQKLADYLYGRFSDYTDKDSAFHVRSIIQIPTEFAQYVLLNCQLIATEIVLVSVSAAALFVFKSRLFVILVLTLAPAVSILLYLTRKRLFFIKLHIKTVAEKALRFLQEALSGFVESNIYDKNQYFIGRHRKEQRRLGNYIADMQIVQDLPSRCFEVFAILGLFILMIMSGLRPGGDYTMIINAFMAAAYKIIPGAARIVNLNNQLRTYLFTVDQTGGAAHIGTSEEDVSDELCLVSLQHLSFSYNEGHMLLDFSAEFRKGTLTVICGQSGKGKSTLFNLLLNFCSPETGDIYFNGQRTSGVNPHVLWKKISYVRQVPFLLHATLLDNIVLFEKGYNEQRLSYALEVSGAGKVFDNLNQVIMENGRNISGGQRKRIMLARALYKDFDLLLLDEPFSELDADSENEIMGHLAQVAASGKIIILISHNKGVKKFCHQVIDLDQRAGQEKVS